MSKLKIFIPIVSALLITAILILFFNGASTGNIPFKYKDRDSVMAELSLKSRREINEILNKFKLDQSDSLPLYQALGKLDSALILLPDDVHLYYMKLEPLLLLKRTVELERTLDIIFRLDPEPINAIELKSLLCEKQNKPDLSAYYHKLAIRIYESRLDSSDAKKFIHYSYAISVNELFLNDREKGLKRLESLFVLFPKEEYYIRNYIELYETLDKEEFLKMF